MTTNTSMLSPSYTLVSEGVNLNAMQWNPCYEVEVKPHSHTARDPESKIEGSIIYFPLKSESVESGFVDEVSKTAGGSGSNAVLTWLNAHGTTWTPAKGQIISLIDGKDVTEPGAFRITERKVQHVADDPIDDSIIVPSVADKPTSGNSHGSSWSVLSGLSPLRGDKQVGSGGEGQGGEQPSTFGTDSIGGRVHTPIYRALRGNQEVPEDLRGPSKTRLCFFKQDEGEAGSAPMKFTKHPFFETACIDGADGGVAKPVFFTESQNAADSPILGRRGTLSYFVRHDPDPAAERGTQSTSIS